MIIPNSVDAELDEDNDIFRHRAQRSNQPRKIGDNVLPLGGVTQDTRTVGKVTQEGKNEEQKRQPFAGLVAIILIDLRQSRTVAFVSRGPYSRKKERSPGKHSPQVTDRTEIAQHLPTSSFSIVIMTLQRRRRPHASLPSHCPPRHTDHKDTQNTEEVLNPRLAPILVLLYNLRERVLSLAFAPTSGSLVAAQRTRRPSSLCRWDSIAESATQERGGRVGGFDR